MNQQENRFTYPFPKPKSIKAEQPTETAPDTDDEWQAKESFPKLRLTRIASPKSKKIRKISTDGWLGHLIDKYQANNMNNFKELGSVYKNNLDRLKTDYDRKLTEKMADKDTQIQLAKMKKWCSSCYKEVKFDTGFNPSACSIECWKKLL